MVQHPHNINAMRTKALDALRAVETAEALREWHRTWLGRRDGTVTQILRTLKELPQEERRVVGAAANALRGELKEQFGVKQEELTSITKQPLVPVDVTAPGHAPLHGRKHPLTVIREQAEEYFCSLGFIVADGPEIETEWYNFEALNIPSDHPARDMHDTLWLRSSQKSQKLLLRTHISPVQVRYMEASEPPLRMIVPGRVYRHEATDATHSHTFDYLEGLMVDKDVTLANFKAVIEGFFVHLLGSETAVRLRPAYFPFTEPSVEVEAHWQGEWLEMAGAGMVHQNVFTAAGYVPGEWQGFAFGFGLDRLAMVKYGIDDIRLLYENDLRFLEQF